MGVSRAPGCGSGGGEQVGDGVWTREPARGGFIVDVRRKSVAVAALALSVGLVAAVCGTSTASSAAPTRASHPTAATLDAASTPGVTSKTITVGSLATQSGELAGQLARLGGQGADGDRLGRHTGRRGGVEGGGGRVRGPGGGRRGSGGGPTHSRHQPDAEGQGRDGHALSANIHDESPSCRLSCPHTVPDLLAAATPTPGSATDAHVSSGFGHCSLTPPGTPRQVAIADANRRRQKGPSASGQEQALGVV